MFSWIGHIGRLLRVAWILVRYDALLPREYEERMGIPHQVFGDVLRLFARRRKPRTVGARLAAALEKLGPAYVKVGQFLATRPDMIGVAPAQELGRLKDRLPPFRASRRWTPSTPSWAPPKHSSAPYRRPWPPPRSPRCTRRYCPTAKA